jgi:hypothetical protein
VRLSREDVTELGDGALQHVDLRAELAEADPDPEPRGVDRQPFDLAPDLSRPIPVEGKDADAELDARGRGRETLRRGSLVL